MQSMDVANAHSCNPWMSQMHIHMVCTVNFLVSTLGMAWRAWWAGEIGVMDRFAFLPPRRLCFLCSILLINGSPTLCTCTGHDSTRLSGWGFHALACISVMQDWGTTMCLLWPTAHCTWTSQMGVGCLCVCVCVCECLSYVFCLAALNGCTIMVPNSGMIAE
jgi:hypothetical protein